MTDDVVDASERFADKQRAVVTDRLVQDAIALFRVLDSLDLPEGTKLRGTREGTEVTEPCRAPYLLRLKRAGAHDPLA